MRWLLEFVSVEEALDSECTDALLLGDSEWIRITGIKKEEDRYFVQTWKGEWIEVDRESRVALLIKLVPDYEDLWNALQERIVNFIAKAAELHETLDRPLYYAGKLAAYEEILTLMRELMRREWELSKGEQ